MNRYRAGPIVALALLCAALPADAQSHAKRDSTLSTILKQQSDTFFRDKGRPAYVERARLRVLAISDSLKHSKTDTVVRVDTIYVTKPDTTPPPPIIKPVASVDVQPASQSINIGSTLQLYADPKAADGSILIRPVRWSVSDTSIANVSGTGLLTGRKAGTVVATALAITPDSVRGTRSYTVAGATPPDTAPPTPIPVDTSRYDGIAELPRGIPKAVYPTCLRNVPVASTANFQTALNSAVPGDCLNLAPDATYVGNFTLPNKGPSTSWITIQTDPNVMSAAPPPGTRITPTIAAALRFAKIQANSYNEAIRAANGAHHYRFSRVEIGTTPAAQPSGMNELIEIIGDYTQHHFQFDQVYGHGEPTLDIRRLLRADADSVVVVDGWWAEGHSNNSDSQCWIVIVNGKRQLYENNYCSAGHELFMAGGGDPPDSTKSPSDIVIRRNHIVRPLAWKGVWQAKNLLETKNIKRLLIEGNIMENSWPDAQAGFCFVLKSENQDGTAPWTTTSDVTVRYNILRRCASGFNLSGKGSSSSPNITSARYSIHDNQLDSLAKYGGDGIPLQLLSLITDVNFFKNTSRNGYPGGSNSFITLDGAPAALKLSVRNNIAGRGAYGVKGGGTGEGTQSLDKYAQPYTFTNNTLVANWAYPAPPCSAYPTSTVCASTFPAANLTIGADSAKIALFTNGVVVPYTPPPALMTLRGVPRPNRPVPVTPPECQKPIPASTCRDVPMGLK